VLGDFLSFWFGGRFSSRLRQVWPFNRRPDLMANAHLFFHRYGVLSVALCRFVPVLRSTVPLVAGMAGMPRRRFVTANVASALIWAPVHIYPAQMAGLSIDRLRQGDWSSAALWSALLVACVAAGWAAHHVLVRRRR
jgi:membrane protein DedA with SNARE-associated domain